MNQSSMFHKMTAWIDKRVNPIALLETHQVLSLKRTLIVYGLLVIALWMGSCTAIAESAAGNEMSILLLSTYGIIATLILPAQILFNSSQRWSKDKLDMIHLTQLRPMDIVLGRLFSGAALLILLGSIVVPFVALTYLMPGTQIDLVLLGMLLVFMVGILTILFTLNAAWRLEEYTFASIGKVFWLFMLLQGSFGIVGLTVAFVENTSTAELFDMVEYLPWGIAGWCLLVYIGISQSVLLFRHPESNRSTPYRLGVLMTYLLGMAALVQFVKVSGVSTKELSWVCIIATMMCGLSCMPLMLEDEVVGRKAFVELPSSRIKRMLLFPLLPSAGSGMVFMMLMMGGVMVVALWNSTPVMDQQFQALLYTPLQTFTCVALLLPLLRKKPLVSMLSRRNLILIAYFPAISAPFLILGFLVRDFVPVEYLLTYILPFGGTSGVGKNTGRMMLPWAIVGSTLTFALHYRMIRGAWDVLVNGRHPKFDIEQSTPHLETNDGTV